MRSKRRGGRPRPPACLGANGDRFPPAREDGTSSVIFNLFTNDWDEHRSNPGSAWSRAGVGRHLGGELLGASLYQLPPGQRSWPYHTHYGNEELLVVLDGRPTLRTPEGERELRAGDTTIFRRGPEGAHEIINRSDEPARFVMVSTMVHPEVAHYPDDDKIGLFAGAPPVPGENAPIELLFDQGHTTDRGDLERPGA
jgi:uncharacterized cupin superfamily protein